MCIEIQANINFTTIREEFRLCRNVIVEKASNRQDTVLLLSLIPLCFGTPKLLPYTPSSSFGTETPEDV